MVPVKVYLGCVEWVVYSTYMLHIFRHKWAIGNSGNREWKWKPKIKNG